MQSRRWCASHAGSELEELICPAMNGTFNGVRLRNIISIGMSSDALYTLRVIGAPLPELEQQLRLNEAALVITSSQEIEGRIVDYHADLTGYDITIESKTNPVRAAIRISKRSALNSLG